MIRPNVLKIENEKKKIFLHQNEADRFQCTEKLIMLNNQKLQFVNGNKTSNNTGRYCTFSTILY